MAASLQLPGGLRTLTAQPEISRYYNNAGTPYTNTAQVLSEVISAARYPGQTFLVGVIEYWFSPTVSDANLIIKSLVPSSTYELLSNKVNNTNLDGTGNKYSTTDAINLLVNSIARASTAIGFIDTTDSFILTKVDDNTLGVAASQYGIIFPEYYKTSAPFAPINAIKNLTARNVPLSAIGLTGTGTAIKYVGWRASDDSVLFSDTSYLQNTTVCQLGIVFVKWSGGVTSFLDATRTVMSIPDISAYSNLETVGIGVKTDVTVNYIAGGMTIKNTSGSVKGISVNWHGSNNDLRVIAGASPTSFQQLHPGNNLTATPPTSTTTVDVTQYWNGTSLVTIPTGQNASVQRIIVTIRGTIIIQYGETYYNTFQVAKDNALGQTFSDILPIGTYTEIGRLVAKRSANDLSDNANAVIVLTSGGGGGTTSFIDISGKEDIANKVSSLTGNETDVIKYPNTKAVSDGLALKSNLKIDTNVQSGTSYTLVNSDSGKQIIFTNSSAITLIIPTGLTSGFSCEVLQQGTGQISIITSGTTIKYSSFELPVTAEIYSIVAIDNVPNLTETYHIFGGLSSI